eukprot:937844-Heterocapsa_arctica.AAC.1
MIQPRHAKVILDFNTISRSKKAMPQVKANGQRPARERCKEWTVVHLAQRIAKVKAKPPRARTSCRIRVKGASEIRQASSYQTPVEANYIMGPNPSPP